MINKKQIWLIVFLAMLLVHLTGIAISHALLQNISKPLLVPVLIGYTVMNAKGGSLKKWIILALLFSWIGDVLLMFVPKADIFFMLGLSSFLLAHIFYIVFFHQLRVRENIKSNPWLLLVVVIYYALLIGWLSPHLAEMKIPVRVYGIVISFMFMLAMHMLFLPDKTVGRLLMFGALLFVISDSVLAINKFYQAFDAAAIIIMLTYGFAQLLLTEGAVRYIGSDAGEDV